MKKIKQNFCKNLKLAIEQSGVKMVDIAKKMQISDSQVSRWVSGKATPSALSLYALCRAIGISSDNLFAGDFVYSSPQKSNVEGAEEDCIEDDKAVRQMKDKLIQSLEKQNQLLEEKIALLQMKENKLK